MSAKAETLSPELVISQLRKSGFVKSSQNLELQPLARNPGRLDHATRLAFRVLAEQKSVCYLLVGPNLSEIWDRAREFAEACPAIAAKALFFEPTPQADVLGLEFIEGRILDEMPPSAALEAAAGAVLAALERTFKPSSLPELNAELERFFSWVATSPIFGAIDSGFLREMIFPWVREGARHQPIQTRWTNGDFTAHNVIIDSHGRPRLIDYEYAQLTHFHLEDFLRWRTYSNAQKHVFDSKLGPPPPWLEAYFLLRQIVLEREVASPEIALAGAEERVRRLRELAAAASKPFHASIFLKPLTREADQEKRIQDLTEETVERGKWGQALEQNLRTANERILSQQTQIQDLDAEVVKRGEWGITLDQKLLMAEHRIAELAAIEAQAPDRVARTEENLQNLEQQMVHAQSLTAKLMSEIEMQVDRAASLERTNETERREQADRSSEERLRRSSLEDKIARMQNSFSWKLTSPLRAFRRLFLDK